MLFFVFFINILMCLYLIYFIVFSQILKTVMDSTCGVWYELALFSMFYRKDANIIQVIMSLVVINVPLTHATR